MRMYNLHRSRILSSSWQWIKDKWCGWYLENATVMPLRAFDISGFNRDKCMVASCKQLVHFDLYDEMQLL